MNQTDVPEASRSGVATVTDVALLVGGTCLALLVAAEGSPLWRLVRAAVVLGLTGLALEAGRRSRPLAAGAALVAGVVHTVVGAGIGLRHLTLDGWSATAAVGLVEFVCGLVLLVAATAVALRGRARRVRVVAVPLLLTGVGLVALVTVPAIMATNVPPLDAEALEPADVGLAAEDVRFEAADGTRLAAWYVPPRNGRVVIVRHGASSTRSDALAQAAVLAGDGYGVLVTDARGHGASGGRAMDFGWYGDEDVVAALDLLAGRPDVERVAVLGLSMGGEEAIGAAAADDRVAAVVAEGATGRTDADKAWLSDEYGVRGWLQRGVDWLSFTLADALTGAGKPTALADAVERSDASFLLIAAGDVADEQDVAKRLQARAPERVEVWTVPGAGHTDGLAVDPAGWEERVVGFLDRVLETPAA